MITRSMFVQIFLEYNSGGPTRVDFYILLVDIRDIDEVQEVRFTNKIFSFYGHLNPGRLWILCFLGTDIGVQFTNALERCETK